MIKRKTKKKKKKRPDKGFFFYFREKNIVYYETISYLIKIKGEIIMKNEYEIKKLKSWLENINLANNTLADIEDEYCGGIDYEDGEFTRSDMDDLFRLLSNLEEALEKVES